MSKFTFKDLLLIEALIITAGSAKGRSGEEVYHEIIGQIYEKDWLLRRVKTARNLNELIENAEKELDKG